MINENEDEKEKENKNEKRMDTYIITDEPDECEHDWECEGSVGYTTRNGVKCHIIEFFCPKCNMIRTELEEVDYTP